MDDNSNTTRVYLTESLSSPRTRTRSKTKDEGSFLATFLKIVGIITIIGGVVLGILLANSSEITALKGFLSQNPSALFNIVVMAVCWIISLISGLLLVGLGEVIRLLQSMNSKMEVK